MKKKRDLRMGDIFLITFILMLSIFLFVVFRPEGAATLASISVDGQTVKQISLPCYETIELDNGVTVVFDGMRACISSSDCPDKTCVHKGWLSIAGQTAVCLPNRTVLSLDGDAIIIGG